MGGTGDCAVGGAGASSVPPVVSWEFLLPRVGILGLGGGRWLASGVVTAAFGVGRRGRWAMLEAAFALATGCGLGPSGTSLAAAPDRAFAIGLGGRWFVSGGVGGASGGRWSMSEVTLGFGWGGGVNDASDWSRASGDAERLAPLSKVDVLAIGRGGAASNGAELAVGNGMGGRWSMGTTPLCFGRAGGRGWSTEPSFFGFGRAGGRGWSTEPSFFGFGRGGRAWRVASDDCLKEDVVLSKVGILGLGGCTFVAGVGTSAAGVGRGGRWSR